ncbi:NADH-ubiquinone oxidoreductase 9.5 kDa subunit, partial [Punctularia strigosozonata HHB-11173 SS5]
AHEYPVLFYSICLGSLGPIMVLTVPPIRRSLGWTPAPPIPTSYPLPDRPRRPVTGYDD